MSDKQFTFFEFHFHDGFQVGPRSLDPVPADELTDATDESSTTATESTATTTEESSEPSGPSVLGPLLGFGVLAGLAYAVRKLLAGAEPEGLDALDDVDEEVGSGTDDREAEAEESVPIEITSPEEEDGGGLGLLLAGAVVLLALFALAAKRLLGGSEEIVVEE